MRARKKKYTAERLTRQKNIMLTEQEFYSADWAEVFQNKNPIHLELGCGKGSFVIEMAKRNQGVNFVALEKIPDVLVTAVEKAAAENLSNLRFVNADAALVNFAFRQSSVTCIYINFCDPWLKKKQHKRRLTHQNFLKLYAAILKEGGRLCLKTDNRELFDFSLEEIKAFGGFSLQNVTFDLHKDSFEGNILTEYEQKFSAAGLPIHRLEAVKKQK